MDAIGSRILSAHKECQPLLNLQAADLTDNHVPRLIDPKSNDLAAKRVMGIQHRSYEIDTRQSRAREIMSTNFFGIEEAIKYFGVNASKQELIALSEVPFPETELAEKKDTHVLVAIFPFSILDIHGKVERKLFYRHENAWYNEQAFAKDKGETSWRLVRKAPVSHSTSKTWDEQQVLLVKNEETPTARVMTYTIIGHFLATGNRLFEKMYVRCSDLDSAGIRIYVGYFGASGLDIDRYWKDNRFSFIGLSSARKLD